MTPEAPTIPPMGVPLAEIIRGGRVESAHHGVLIIADTRTAIASALGDPELVIFPRSGLKPFQVLPFLRAGGAERFGLSDAELAIMVGSHGGEPRHVATVAGILKKIGGGLSDLACGAHAPLDPRAAGTLAGAPTALHNNCSGKHTSMMAFARLMGWPHEGYLESAHPVQVAIREALEEVLEVTLDAASQGVDGCSAPTYAVPLRAAALGFARLANPAAAPERWRGPLTTVARAMRAHPVHVGGSLGRLDTDLMLLGRGLVAKVGAEGFFAVGRAGGQGLALKILDGDPTWRAHPVAIVGALQALGWLDAADTDRLARYGPLVPIVNWAGRRTGELRASAAIRAFGSSPSSS